LDELIRQYGTPGFVKIDVEGCEDQVLRGCSHRLRAVSFEFTPERMAPALACIDILERLGSVVFNYTIEGKRSLQLERWVSGSELKDKLSTTHFAVSLTPPGDIYARSLEF
jgi:hypothetical protein